MESKAPSRILITGASGFVGKHLLPLIQKNLPLSRLFATSRHSVGPQTDVWVHCDISDHENCSEVIRAIRPDAILHLAAQSSVNYSFEEPLLTWRANLIGTINLAEAVLQQVPQCLFLYASSAEIYGLSFAAGRPLTEDAVLKPSNPYAASKAAADIAMGEMALRGLRCLRLRPFNHTGPGQEDRFVVSSFARQIARIEVGLQPPELSVGALDRWRDFLDVRDVCRGYIAALRLGHGIAPGTAINFASGRSIRIGELLETLLAKSRKRIAVRTEVARLRPTDLKYVQGDASRATQLLGWAPSITWDETLQSVLDDWRQRVLEQP